jgi:hypothetical protein
VRGPDYYIYLDEYQRDGFFVLVGALVSADTISVLRSDWNALRLTIKQALLRDYPHARWHPFLAGDQLPEIHAVDMFQSSGYFRKYRRGEEIQGDVGGRVTCKTLLKTRAS